MSQTKKGSFIESIANVVVGFGISWTANMVLLPLFGFNVTGAQAFWIGVIMTFVSVARSYLLRRLFNKVKTRWNIAEDPFAVHKAALDRSRDGA